ncbi:hypothetical protein GCM10010909_22390 [Acidocella aquatica]|uniref:Uncharacterized protein n=1 Tax=Acidocella aquatica TaxID=1922313 RepID=A0ABQ6A8D0_9PROT|nr:hypothetical protein [Acidocella aquatica]GLR67558.1 hypothetical protein GCM10010909_22390 [Acidocella aquatica]
MVGDTSDMLARLKMVLPGRWFSDSAPVLEALLTGLASAWSGLYALLGFVQAQTRIGSASGIFLDIASADYMGGALPRRAGEADVAYRARIRNNLVAPRATRAGLVEALRNLTGRVPMVFEPMNAGDTGGYNVNLGYNIAGGYGSLDLPYQFFLTAYRPNDTPISNAGGYSTGPGGYNEAPMFYAAAAEFPGVVSDADIYAAVAAVIPISSIAWTQISN